MQSYIKHGYKICSKKNLWLTLEGFNHVNKWQGTITTLLEMDVMSKIWHSYLIIYFKTKYYKMFRKPDLTKIFS